MFTYFLIHATLIEITALLLAVFFSIYGMCAFWRDLLNALANMRADRRRRLAFKHYVRSIK